MAGITYSPEVIGGGYGGGWGNDWIVAAALFGGLGGGFGYGRNGGTTDVVGYDALLEAQTNSNIVSGNYALSGELATDFAMLGMNQMGIATDICRAEGAITDKIADFGVNNLMATTNAECNLQRAVDRNGFEGYQNAMLVDGRSQVRHDNTKDQLFAMQTAAANCCCETNLNITKTAYETQLRDLANKCDTDTRIDKLAQGQQEILCAIENAQKDNKIAQLEAALCATKEQNERFYAANLSARTNCLIDAVGDSLKANFGADYPWVINNCCGIGGGLI